MKKIIFTIIILIIVCVISIVYFFPKKNISEYQLNTSIKALPTLSATQSTLPTETAVAVSTNSTNVPLISQEKIISVPFADQAPFKDWGDPYQEACEETSIIMAKAFKDGNNAEDLDKSYINEQILALVDYQNKNWSGHHDLDTQLTLKLMQDFYGLDGKIETINSADDIKEILAQGKIIIAPTYGKKLDNPNFTAPGPVYHMLVIKGYTNTNFITNDPGVWQGKSFNYPFDTLFMAIADLPQEAAGKKGYIKEHEDLMQNTTKNIIVIR